MPPELLGDAAREQPAQPVEKDVENPVGNVRNPRQHKHFSAPVENDSELVKYLVFNNLTISP
jgi:hypothetical protein